MGAGWIKLHRSLQQWEWYTVPHMMLLFLHLLLSANHKDGKWRGHEVKRGQLITGLNSLSKETGLSVKTIRTCLSRFQKSGEIGKYSGNQFSIITILNYDKFQDSEDHKGSPGGTPRATQGQAKGNKQEVKNLKKEPLRNFDTFWQAYPKKRSKQKAKQIWSKLNPDAVLFEKIMGAVITQAKSDDWQKEGGRYVPLPTTWLNGHRWEDEIDTEQVQSSSELKLVAGRRVF